ncbi:hypothetical protein ACFL2T_05615 [Elusimicrobiota bacterium]
MKQNVMPYNSIYFLNTRQQVISLRPTASPIAGYIWRRIFLKGGRDRTR